MTAPIDPYAPGGLAAALAGQPAYRHRQVRAWLARGVDDPAAMTDLPKAVRDHLSAVLPPPPRVLRVSESDPVDGDRGPGLTRKVLLECGDGDRAEAIESVLMLYPRRRAPSPARAGRAPSPARAGRATVCISTQAGCAMGCPFCATGQVGFRRQLTTGEVVRQVTIMQRLLADGGDLGSPLPSGVPDHVTNVVFMGMGEPLANLDVTLQAVQWLHDPEGFNLSARSITVSTVGLVPGIRRLQALDLPVTLAVSLHAPDDDLRDDLVPVNRTHPLEELLDACVDYLQATGRRLTFEYVLIDGVNASVPQAHTLRDLLRRHLPPGAAHVNLIPMNPTPAVPWRAPSVDDQRAFRDVLVDGGVAATIRHNRGGDIDAACGQLYANYTVASGRSLPLAVGAAERVQERVR